jgi:hypothetical protein
VNLEDALGRDGRSVEEESDYVIVLKIEDQV